ncbi:MULTISPECIES: glycoside hydrolase family 65 protein [Lactiplantibacillus]|uniref:glycoside hydrolase family 65 protein n=1 Tax=Lactiplantibacillus TaxID=2767842 RepID=UPI001C1F2F88|nr:MULTISPECIES: glycosyl hydrolase family 65 protein [Lactiplantibacillus]MBU7449506.1 glycoside hydrolase family 65 protein [Lactiplantibacillus sp. 7.2.4]MBU7481003.1 glycoside hydrolase family 65 protein [Lactiplantibacillus pentosus]MBU7502246.1 glycoside hydrolase family 65 protein [Lactiplantibacillus pentosus]MDY1543783.1 glycosyl hydrolase family 65 protein [Lactiplantibacillus pentosus]
MQLGVGTDPSNPWILQEKEFNSRHLGKFEAVMCQGNGYMGVRAATEEHYVGEHRDMLIAGTFDKFDGEVNELPNLPDVTEIKIEINGQLLDLNQGEVSDYRRIIDLKSGLLTRSFTWTIAEHAYRLKFERLVSMANRHLIVSRVTITPLDGQAIVKVQSGIDGQQTNSGSQHLVEGDKRLFDGEFMQMLTSTNESKINMAMTTCHKFKTADGHAIKQHMEIGRRQVFFNFTDTIAAQATLQFVKYSTLVTDRDNDFQGQDLAALQEFGLTQLKTACAESFDEQLAATTAAWQQSVWDYGKLQIESSDMDDQVALNFARYQLAISTPVHDHRMNIGAKGLTGEGYKGHTFWDTEIFMLPYYIFTKPEVAKSLIEYRYLGLAGAHRKSQDNKYAGAQFPWEAAWPSDGESTPVWGAADIITGRAMKIWSGFIEQHITSDVAYGAMEYVNATGDDQFALDKVYEIILDAARFWASRLEYNETADRYEINDVIGPDEYKEHINNNAFTNYTAQWTLQTAIDLYEVLKTNEPKKFAELNQKLDLDKYYQLWQAQVDKIYLLQPNADGVIPENDTYLSLKTIDLSKYKTAEHVGGIFNDYNLDQISKIQVTKQADVLLLLYLFEQKFAAQEKRINWDYYEPRTTHDSSLSLSTHAVLASDLKMTDKAYELFQRACQIDIGPDMASSNDGTHSASLGGIWNAVVFGFGGVRLLGETLRIEPHLPEAWTNLSFEIFWQQQRLRITVGKSRLTVKALDATAPVSFEHRGKQYRLSENESAIIDL